jgi:hypothetical protein
VVLFFLFFSENKSLRLRERLKDSDQHRFVASTHEQEEARDVNKLCGNIFCAFAPGHVELFFYQRGRKFQI